MELYGFMEREKKIPSYFFIITKGITNLMLSRNLCEFFPLQSLENAFSALELYLALYIIVHSDIS